MNVKYYNDVSLEKNFPIAIVLFKKQNSKYKNIKYIIETNSSIIT